MSGFGIFKTREQSRQDRADSDKEQAQQLISILKKHKLMVRGKRPPIEEWSTQFRLLRTKEEVSAKKIQQVLDWYCQNVQDEYVPRALNAKQFRYKFFQLTQARKRHQETPEKKEIVISDWTEQLQKRLMLRWPKEEKEKQQEARFIQLTYDNYSNYRKALRQLLRHFNGMSKTRFEDIRLHRLLRYLWRTEQDVPQFTEQWLRNTHRIAWRWKKWNGNLLKWHFRIDSRLFTERQEEAVSKYLGLPSYWNIIREMLHNAD